MTGKKSSLGAILTPTEKAYLNLNRTQQQNRKLDYTIRNRVLKGFAELIWILSRVKPRQRHKIIQGLLMYFDPDFFEAWLRDEGRIRGPIHHYLPRNLIQELIPHVVETSLEFSKQIWNSSRRRDPTSFMRDMEAKGLPGNRRFWYQWFGHMLMEETFIHPLTQYFPNLISEE